MITEIEISNFRSIDKCKLPVKKLNILYGPNGSGKSSILYAPYVMRNFFVNPNQKLNSLFNLGFINLGAYDNVCRINEFLSSIDISITSEINDNINKQYNQIKYTLILDDFGSAIEFKIAEFGSKLNIDIPFTLSERKEVDIGGNSFLWNGLTFEGLSNKNNGISNPLKSLYLNTIYEDIKKIEIISVKRGFFSPIFSTESGNEESIFAMQIRDEGLDFELKIDKYFNSIFDKNFRFVAIPGSTSFYLRTHNKEGKVIDLVNEGFGVNQAIYMLIKLLKKNTALALIEEPEIHLHPSAQKKIVDVFIDIIREEKKQIFLTTHSENIVSSVLTKIASRELDKDDVQFFLSQNVEGASKIIPQKVNDKGQIEGGLLSFMEAELSNLKNFLGI